MFMCYRASCTTRNSNKIKTVLFALTLDMSLKIVIGTKM